VSAPDQIWYDRFVRIALLVLLAGLAVLMIATSNRSADTGEEMGRSEGAEIAAGLSSSDLATIRRWVGAVLPPVERCKRQMDAASDSRKSACASARRWMFANPVPQLADSERTERLRRVQRYCQRVLAQRGGGDGTKAKGAFLKDRAYIGICREMLSRFAQEVGAVDLPARGPDVKADRPAPR